MLLTVITPTIRPEGALEAARSVRAAAERAPGAVVRHVIAHWTAPRDETRRHVAPWLTELIRDCPPGWIFFLDDDTRMHPDLVAALLRVTRERPDAVAVVFGMHHPQVPEIARAWQLLPPTPGRIDGGQVALLRDYAVLEPWRAGPTGDGQYLAALYPHAPTQWVAVPGVLAAHNHQEHGHGW